MLVTKVSIRKLTNAKRLVGIATITLDDAICITGIKLVEAQNKLVIVMPEKEPRNKDVSKDTTSDRPVRRNRSIAFPVNKFSGDIIRKAIEAEWNRLNSQESPAPVPVPTKATVVEL